MATMLDCCRGVALPAFAWVVAGCTNASERPPGGDWISARIVQVRRADEPGPELYLRCVDRAALDTTMSFVVVRYRSTNMQHDRALFVPSTEALRVGDVVFVDTQRCVVKRPAAQ